MSTVSHLINDPIYGPIEIPKGTIPKVIAHPYFQRLRRIVQLGFTHYVFPGATHTRFSHALGAMHLTQRAIRELRNKGIAISDEEAEALNLAVLLHDLGHAPFSHSSEFVLLDIPHEELSILLMEKLNEDFTGRLDMCLAIFRDEYPKKFLHQLTSGQLDMDRLDYLTRDSFFTGVSEGVVGYKRLLKMLDVHQDQLIFHRKGIYSVEQFLMARRYMYWQVYLHKTVFGASALLTKVIKRVRYLISQGIDCKLCEALDFFLERKIGRANFNTHKSDILKFYPSIDDTDIMNMLKIFSSHQDFVLNYLSCCLLRRQLFKVKSLNKPVDRAQLEKLRQEASSVFEISLEETSYLVFCEKQSNQAYQLGKEEIQIRSKNGKLRPISEYKEITLNPENIKKYYLCYPKELNSEI